MSLLAKNVIKMFDVKEGTKYLVIGAGFVGAGLLLQPILAQWTKNTLVIGLIMIFAGLAFVKQEGIMSQLGKGTAVAGAVLVVSPMLGPVLQNIKLPGF